MTSLLKQWENLYLPETKQNIHHESFPKMQFLLKSSDGIKSYSHLSKILAYFSQFLPDLSLVILKLRDHGCQF